MLVFALVDVFHCLMVFTLIFYCYICHHRRRHFWLTEWWTGWLF